jgi:hypothetical protein
MFDADDDPKIAGGNAAVNEGGKKLKWDTGPMIAVRVAGKMSAVQKRHLKSNKQLNRTESGSTFGEQLVEIDEDDDFMMEEAEDGFSVGTMGMSSVGTFGERKSTHGGLMGDGAASEEGGGGGAGRKGGRDRNTRTLWQSNSGGVGLVDETPRIVTTLDDEIITSAVTNFSSILSMVKKHRESEEKMNQDAKLKMAQRIAAENKERERIEREQFMAQREKLLFDNLGIGGEHERPPRGGRGGGAGKGSTRNASSRFGLGGGKSTSTKSIK